MDKKTLQKLANGNGFTQVPVEFQLPLLGFPYRNCRGLDIACGNGSLVKELRGKGFDFEGIDSQAPSEGPFITQNIYGMYPMDGAIPRPNETYDLVVSFQNVILNRGFTFGGIVRNPRLFGGNEAEIRDHDRRLQTAQFMVYEALRVLKPNGRIVFYPECKRLEEVMGASLRLSGMNVKIGRELVDRDVAERYLQWEESGDYLEEYFQNWGLLARTVVSKD